MLTDVGRNPPDRQEGRLGAGEEGGREGGRTLFRFQAGNTKGKLERGDCEKQIWVTWASCKPLW